jgi:hypothetical protein
VTVESCGWVHGPCSQDRDSALGAKGWGVVVSKERRQHLVWGEGVLVPLGQGQGDEKEEGIDFWPHLDLDGTIGDRDVYEEPTTGLAAQQVVGI